MATAIALPGFNDFGRSVTPIFLLKTHFFLPIFYGRRKDEENLSVTSLNFSSCKMHDQIPLLSIRAVVSNASSRVTFYENISNV